MTGLQHGNIVAAVNAGSEQTPSQLAKPTHYCSSPNNWQRLLNGKVQLVNAFPGTPVNIAIEIPEFNPQEYNQTMKTHHLEAVQKLALEFELPFSTDSCAGRYA